LKTWVIIITITVATIATIATIIVEGLELD